MDKRQDCRGIAAEEESDSPIPVDMSLHPSSGLDRYLTAQPRVPVSRVANESRAWCGRGAQACVSTLKAEQFGLLGEPRVNVLELNLALDAVRQ
jgi:K+-transporting ATPase ATPase C chain